MVKNINGVSAKQWRQWDEDERALFNNVYRALIEIGPALFLHPKTVARKLSADEFKTIAWNAAWEAADQLANPGLKPDIVTIAA